jgi:hypothetical protein
MDPIIANLQIVRVRMDELTNRIAATNNDDGFLHQKDEPLNNDVFCIKEVGGKDLLGMLQLKPINIKPFIPLQGDPQAFSIEDIQVLALGLDQQATTAVMDDVFDQDEHLKPVSDDILDDVNGDDDLYLEPLLFDTCKVRNDLLPWFGNIVDNAPPTAPQAPRSGTKHRHDEEQEELNRSSMNPTKRPKFIVSDDDCSNSSSEFMSSYHERHWTEKFQELLNFKGQHGHCRVPHMGQEAKIPIHAKAKQKKTTITDYRVEALGKIGFVWDSHNAAWEDRVRELGVFRMSHGHTNVPGNYPNNPQLSTWVECQRRQCRLYLDGKPSNISSSRIDDLEQLGFEWTVRTATGAL